MNPIDELKTWLKKHNDLTKKRDLAMMELLDVEGKLDFVSGKILSLVEEAGREGEEVMRCLRFIENAILPAALIYFAAQMVRWGANGFAIVG